MWSKTVSKSEKRIKSNASLKGIRKKKKRSHIEEGKLKKS